MAASARRADASSRVTPKTGTWGGLLPACGPSAGPPPSYQLSAAEVQAAPLLEDSAQHRGRGAGIAHVFPGPHRGPGPACPGLLGGRSERLPHLLPVTLLPRRLLMTPAPVQAWPQPAGHIPLTGLSSAPAAGRSGHQGGCAARAFPVALWVTGSCFPPAGSGLGAGSQPCCWGEMRKVSGDTGMTWPRVAVEAWEADWDRQLQGATFHASPPCQPAKGERASEWDRAEARACREEQAGECVGPRLLLSLSVF